MSGAFLFRPADRAECLRRTCSCEAEYRVRISARDAELWGPGERRSTKLAARLTRIGDVKVKGKVVPVL